MHGGAAVAVEQLQEAPLAGLHRRDLRAQVAHGAARQPHVLADDLDQVWLTTPRSWYFRIGICSPSEKMSVVMPPSMPPMSSQCAMQHEKPTSSPLWKIGKVKVTWLRWLPVEIGIVGDVDVARLDIGEPEMPDLGLHGLGHAADEHRQPDADRDGLALRGEQPGGEVERLVDDHVVGGAHEVGLHFLGHRDDAVAHDLGHHRIGLALMTLPTLGARLARSRLGRELGPLLRHGVYRPPATAITRLP